MGNCQESKIYQNFEVCCGTDDPDSIKKHQPEILAGIQNQNLQKIKNNAKVLKAIIKLQAVYRGYRTRKLIKTHTYGMSMGGRHFGGGIGSGGEYRSQNVEQIRQLLGEFKFGSDKDFFDKG